MGIVRTLQLDNGWGTVGIFDASVDLPQEAIERNRKDAQRIMWEIEWNRILAMEEAAANTQEEK
ncbi:MAG: hypothetical protein RR382_13820 [Tannerellaceae bacterium]